MSRVILIDDHEVIALALREALADETDLDFAGVAPTVDEALALCGESDDDGVAVLDLRLSDGSSPVRNVDRLVAGGFAVVAYTSGESPYLLRLAAQTPILALVRKSEPLARLIEALREAGGGRATMSTEWAAAIDSDPGLDAAALSEQEQHVLRLFAAGLKSQAVASGLGIAPSTVDDYVRRIRTKYARIGRDAGTKIDLYKRAVEDGFLPPPSPRA